MFSIWFKNIRAVAPQAKGQSSLYISEKTSSFIDVTLAAQHSWLQEERRKATIQEQNKHLKYNFWSIYWFFLTCGRLER